MTSNAGAVVESQMPGRVRFRLPKEQRSDDVISEIKSILSSAEGIVDIAANAATGSVLVQHDPSVVSSDDLVRYARDARIVSDVVKDVAELEHVSWPGKCDSAISVLRRFKRFDQRIGRLTGGSVDGKMLVVILLVGVSAVRAFWGRRQMPTPWHALLWYGYSVFMQWHSPVNHRG